MRRSIWWGWGVLVLLLGWLPVAHGATFGQLYSRGKVLLKQRLYTDAARELQRASQTPRGGKHFGTHYFWGLALYRLGRVGAAMEALDKAKGFAQNNTQRGALKRLRTQVKSLFGAFQIVPQVDPDQVGRLKLTLRASAAFSHPQKRRIFGIYKKRWAQRGLRLQGQTFYLPKGSYTISIQKTQCLRYGLVSKQSLVKSFSISSAPVVLSLQEKQSCQCGGGQVVVRTKRRVSCECTKGTVWSQKNKRCEIPKAQASWLAQNWVWVTLLGAGVVAGGAVAVYFLVAPPAQTNIPVEGDQLFPAQK